eukprot:1160744-Pelagomonas_calceolata.AAC.17
MAASSTCAGGEQNVINVFSTRVMVEDGHLSCLPYSPLIGLGSGGSTQHLCTSACLPVKLPAWLPVDELPAWLPMDDGTCLPA